MPTRYCGIGGNDGNSGLTWALRKLTLNGVEDTPVVAGDVCYVGPGAYRETLTCDVSGGAGNPISYIGDVTGEHTDDIGGIVRITGSDNDQAAVRANCVTCGAQRDYRTFRGFMMDTTSNYVITGGATAGTNWIIEDCSFQMSLNSAIYVSDANQADWTIRRCIFWFKTSIIGIYFVDGGLVDNVGHVVENCVFFGGVAIRDDRIGGIGIHNCMFFGSSQSVRNSVALTAGQTIDVDNCIFMGCGTGCWSIAVGWLVEDYNTFYGNGTDRTNVNVGGNSVAYPALFELPLFYAGASQVSGIRFPLPAISELSEWSQVRAIAGASERTVDLLGIARPATAAKNSWGPIQYQGYERDTGTTYDGSTASLALPDAGRVQFKIPTADATEITISVRAYREANYAGTNPRLIVKQPGQADDTTTDAAAASQWNELTTTLTPADEPDYVIVELASLNTAAAGNYAAFFDALSVDSSPSVGDLDNWITDRIAFSDVQAAGGGGAVAAPILGPSVIAR